MRHVFSVFIGCMIIAMFIQPALTEEGVWSPQDRFMQINVGCMRVYTCGPEAAIMHSAEKDVSSSAPKESFGVCSAGGGAIDACNVCLTTPPAEKCEWHLIDKANAERSGG